MSVREREREREREGKGLGWRKGWTEDDLVRTQGIFGILKINVLILNLLKRLYINEQIKYT